MAPDKSFDIVIAPDFTTDANIIYEVRTLFFMASLLEFGGKSRHFPLHIACIGEPPASVVRMAEIYGAEITLHEPQPPVIRGFPNKLRGFEIQGKTGKVLLIDVDVIVLKDLTAMITKLPEDAICLARASRPMVKEKYWEAIYEGIGMAPPETRVSSLCGELGVYVYDEFTKAEMARTFPYYCGGLVFTPWKYKLKDIWETHIREIKMFIKSKENVSDGWNHVNRFRTCDQTGLATSVEYLKRRGAKMQRLPDIYHGLWQLMYSRKVKLDDMYLFHMIGFLWGLESVEEISPEGIRNYQRSLFRRFNKAWRQSSSGFSKVGELFTRFLPAAVDVYKTGKILHHLYDKHVQVVLRESKEIPEEALQKSL